MWRGHEFHYTRVHAASDVRYALELKRGRGIEDGKDGIYFQNVLAGYTHAYFTEKMVSELMHTIQFVQ